MTALRKLERDRLQAEMASIGRMIANFGDEDVVMRMGLEDRLQEIRDGIAQFGQLQPMHAASAALFFGGAPVVGTQGIESEFGSRALTVFQDLVAKQLAHETGGLGQRGIVPKKEAARLHITNVVRGSFGFMLEELDNQSPLLDTSLKDSVDNVADLIAAFGEDDEDKFESAVTEIDERVLATVKEFFGLMRQAGATLRLVNGEKDRSFQGAAIERAELRATTTTFDDREEEVAGVFSAALPGGHLLEFKTTGARGLIRGRVDRSFSPAAITELNQRWMESPAIGKFKVRRVLKDGELLRESFTLLSVRTVDDGA